MMKKQKNVAFDGFDIPSITLDSKLLISFPAALNVILELKD